MEFVDILAHSMPPSELEYPIKSHNVLFADCRMNRETEQKQQNMILDQHLNDLLCLLPIGCAWLFLAIYSKLIHYNK